MQSRQETTPLCRSLQISGTRRQHQTQNVKRMFRTRRKTQTGTAGNIVDQKSVQPKYCSSGLHSSQFQIYNISATPQFPIYNISACPQISDLQYFGIPPNLRSTIFQQNPQFSNISAKPPIFDLRHFGTHPNFRSTIFQHPPQFSIYNMSAGGFSA